MFQISIIRSIGTRAPDAFDLTATALVFKSSLYRSRGRPRFEAALLPLGRLANQGREPLSCVVAVFVLRSEPPGMDYNDTLISETFASQAHKPVTHILRQRGGVGRVKAEFHGCRHLVDILASRTRGEDKLLPDFIFLDGYGRCNSNHGTRFSITSCSKLLKPHAASPS
jgi:hypothetical protein